jgi:hypothetical protein
MPAASVACLKWFLLSFAGEEGREDWMLQGLLFLAGVAAFGLVILWCISNDAPGLGGGDKGLFAMVTRKGKVGRGMHTPRWRR